jgi:hypothetical protein
MSYRRSASIAVISCLVAGCASLAGVQEHYVVCPYDHAWDAALDAVKDRAVTVKDKNKGVIETGWVEMPVPGRTFGAMQRGLGDHSKDRSRLHLNVKHMNDVTMVNFTEEREQWAFRGGSRLFGWAATNPSEDVMREVQGRLAAKLKEHGCLLP